MFESLWIRLIAIQQKIKEIEEGIKPEIIETITNPTKIQTLYLNLLIFGNCRNHADHLTHNAINHQYGIGVFSLLNKCLRK